MKNLKTHKKEMNIVDIMTTSFLILFLLYFLLMVIVQESLYFIVK